MGAWIRDARRPGVRDERNGFATLEPRGQTGGFAVFVVLVEAHHGLTDLVVRQEFRCAPGVLGGYDVHLAKRAQGAKGQVFEIPDWSGNNEEGAGHGDYNCSLLG